MPFTYRRVAVELTKRVFWTDETVNRNSDKAGFSNPHEWCMAKQRELEKETSVKWSWYNAHGGYKFDAIDEGLPIANMVAESDLDSIRYSYKNAPKDFTEYVDYLTIAKATNISLRRLIPIIKWMEKEGIAKRTINRMGKGYAFKLM